MVDHPVVETKIIDPTVNVLQLVHAAVTRLDDLRISADERMRDIMALRERT